MPERLIQLNPDEYFGYTLRSLAKAGTDPFAVRLRTI